MSTNKESKINQLLQLQPKGVVLLASWLLDKGYSFDLQRRYRQSQWLESIGSGAMIRKSDEVDLSGALYALQTQLGMSVHFACKTALSMQGKTHYLELTNQKAFVFGNENEKLPTWLTYHDWGIQLKYFSTKFLQTDVGYTEVEVKEFKIKVSSPARAIMECLYLSPDKQDLLECYDLIEPLNNLRPNQVQELLENCSSVKVKRLFLYMAEKANHSWFQYLNLEKIDLGKGKRSIVKHGIYEPKYQITIPKELVAHDSTL